MDGDERTEHSPFGVRDYSQPHTRRPAQDESILPGRVTRVKTCGVSGRP